MLLMLTMTMWAGNTVAGRLAAPEMSPMIVSGVRWFITCIILLIFGWRTMKADWHVIRPHWKFVVLLSMSGFTMFNAIFYYAAHLTTGINLSIIQGSIPIFVLMGAFLWFGIRSTWFQVIGVMLSLVGILVVASHGKIETLLHLTFNQGDILLLVACLFSAIYALGLRYRPAISGVSFFMYLAMAAFITTLPLMVMEFAQGGMITPSPKGWLIMAYIILCPSILGQIFFIWAIEKIGAARAGIFINLVPVLGALMSVWLLGEEFGAHHAISLALVLSGIFLAEWGKAKPAA